MIAWGKVRTPKGQVILCGLCKYSLKVCVLQFACIKFRFLSFVNMSKKKENFSLPLQWHCKHFFHSVFWGFRTASSAEKQTGYLNSTACENFSKNPLVSLYDCVLQHLGLYWKKNPPGFKEDRILPKTFAPLL